MTREAELGDVGAHRDRGHPVDLDSTSHVTSRNPSDVPFALFHLLDDDGARAQLACSAGFVSADPKLAPAEFDIGAGAR